MLDYRTAIESTQDTINRRATLFRNQAIGVVVLIGVTIAYALVARQLSALLLLLLLVPFCGTFLLIDGVTLRGWRHRLLAAWMLGELDFVAFFSAMRALPWLPQQTLEGMLATLPDAGELTYEQTLRPATRRAIAAASESVRQDEFDVLMLKVIASLVIAVVAVAWVRTQSWVSISGLALLLILPVARIILKRRNRNQREAVMTSCPQEAGFSDVDFQRIRLTLQ